MLLRRVSSQARDLLASWNGRFVFVYLPAENKFTSLTAWWDLNGYRDDVLDVLRDQEIEFLDIRPTLAETDNSPSSVNWPRRSFICLLNGRC